MRCSVVLQIFRLHFSFGPTFPSKLGTAGAFTFALRMEGTNRSSELDGMDLCVSYIAWQRGLSIPEKKVSAAMPLSKVGHNLFGGIQPRHLGSCSLFREESIYQSVSQQLLSHLFGCSRPRKLGSLSFSRDKWTCSYVSPRRSRHFLSGSPPC